MRIHSLGAAALILSLFAAGTAAAVPDAGGASPANHCVGESAGVAYVAV